MTRCKCADSTACHDPASHDTDREEWDAPCYCIDCEEVEVGGEAERCAECTLQYAEWTREPNPCRWEPDTLEEARGER